MWDGMRTQGERDVVTRMNDGWGGGFGLVMIRIGFSKIPCIGQALGRSFYCFFYVCSWELRCVSTLGFLDIVILRHVVSG